MGIFPITHQKVETVQEIKEGCRKLPFLSFPINNFIFLADSKWIFLIG
jgi:hypothetical protein